MLLPLVLLVVVLESAKGARRARALAFVAGAAPLAALWLALEIVRFGAPFASYGGERFSHPPLDGLWRLTVGPNKGLFVYFPLALLGVWGFVRLARTRRVLGLALAGFSAFVLLTTAAWWSWDGTAGWGPRLLVPLVPLLAAAAALAAPALPAAAFAALFALGVAVNALGALQPDAVLTWYYATVKPRVLTAAEQRAFPPFALETDAGGGRSAAPDPRRREPRRALAAPRERLAPRAAPRGRGRPRRPADASVADGRSRAGGRPPARAGDPVERPRLPDVAVPLAAPRDVAFPRVRADDTVLAWIDCLYDQALRAQDMERGDRAVAFAEELYRRVPGAQTAATLAEAYRMAGRREALADFVGSLPPAQKASPEFGMVLALATRDAGNEARARQVLGQVLAVAPAARVRPARGHAARRVARDAAEDPVSGLVPRAEVAVKTRRPLAAALLLAGAVLALTADERVYGLMADGRTMLRTAVSIATLGEIGIARGSAVDVARPGGDAVSRYGMGASLVLVVPALLAPGFEKAFGTGTSQTLFVLLQILLVLLAALAAGLLARAWGGGERAAAGAALATALASPLWAYVALDFSEPLQAALCGGAFARRPRGRPRATPARGGRFSSPRSRAFSPDSPF